MEYRLTTPLTREALAPLRAGDSVLLSGIVYTARDAAHKRLAALLDRGEPLPIPLEGTVIYYVGPTPPRPGMAIGSAGPTTSYRMDGYAPRLLGLGLLGMIGKGKRSPQVVESMIEAGAVYFGAIGGAAALIGRCVTASELIAYEDLGSEAIRKLTVRDHPLTVVIDSRGEDLYQTGPAAYLASLKAAGEQKNRPKAQGVRPSG